MDMSFWKKLERGLNFALPIAASVTPWGAVAETVWSTIEQARASKGPAAASLNVQEVVTGSAGEVLAQLQKAAGTKVVDQPKFDEALHAFVTAQLQVQSAWRNLQDALKEGK